MIKSYLDYKNNFNCFTWLWSFSPYMQRTTSLTLQNSVANFHLCLNFSSSSTLYRIKSKLLNLTLKIPGTAVASVYSFVLFCLHLFSGTIKYLACIYLNFRLFKRVLLKMVFLIVWNVLATHLEYSAPFVL